MTLLFTHPAMLDHDVPHGHPESPQRLRAVLHGVEHLKLEKREAPQAERAPLARVHDESYLDLIAKLHPKEDFVIIDPDTFFSRGTGEAALRAAGGVVAAVDAVLSGEEESAFCAVRPPGHHAEPGQALGFCFYNNVAIGALHALEAYGLGKVAVIDFDVHHGNGTQTIAERDARLFFASTHEWPQYPGTGRREETGIDGNVVNCPLPQGTDGAAFRKIMEREVLPALSAFAPELVLISAGFDAHESDPLAGLSFHEADYAWAARAIREAAATSAKGRVVATLEGGYNLEALARSAGAFCEALATRR